MTEHPILYKFGNRGLEQWRTYVIHHENDSASVIVEWGMVGGSLQEKETLITKGKNIGKSNETTPFQQACSESSSKWLKQKDKGYQENKPTQKNILRPMLAKDYSEFAHKLKFPCYIQPKLDGLRCLASREEMISRKGKKFTCLPHLSELTKSLSRDIVLDGELFNPDLTFQKITSLTRQIEPDPDHKLVQYHVYDMIDLSKPELTFSERSTILSGWVANFNSEHIQFVQTRTVRKEEEIGALHTKFVQTGFEGSILRNDSVYEIDKRSFNLLKLKDFKDLEFEIIGAEEDKNGHCVFQCKTVADAVFSVKCEGTDEERKDMWANKDSYMGKMLNVRFFEWTTSNPPLPRFPVGVYVRDF